MRRTARAALALWAVTALSLGCAGPAVDKHGARVGGDVVTLRLGAADPGEPSLAHFVGAVDRASGGRVAIDVDEKTYSNRTPDAPARLAPDVRAGHVDLAFIPSRDWAATGDPGFAALQAPFLVTSILATTSLARSDVAEGLLQGTAAYGVVGLGLVPGEPRRLLTREPVVDEADLAGARIRINDSEQTTALLSALGADPVQGMSFLSAHQALQHGDLAGVEMSPTYIGGNSYDEVAPYLTSFALVPKFELLAASAASWEDLSAGERAALSKASAETVAWEAGHLARNESAELALLCRNGLVVVAPSASALEAWKRAAAAPTDPSARRVVDDITSSVLHTLPADGAADVPKSCPIATSAAEAHNLHRSARPDVSASVPPTDGPSIPVGTYQERVTVEQFAAAGVYGPDYNEDVTFTWLFRPDGTFLETQKPDYPDQGPQLGHYVVDGNRLTMTYDPTPSGNLPPERVHWSYYEGTLTFSHLEIEDSGSLPLYMQPWHKTA